MKRLSYPSNRQHLMVFAALLALVIAFWMIRIVPVRAAAEPSSFGSDLATYFVPTAAFIHDELSSGGFPLWNPFQLAGQPILALHAPGVLYPPNFLVLRFFGAESGLSILAVLHLTLAGLFSWLFARRIGLGPVAGFCAAIAYAFSAPLLSSIQHPPYLALQPWLPAMLWVLHGLTAEARPSWAIALSLVVSMAFLGGYAQGFVYVVELGLAYGVFRLWTQRGNPDTSPLRVIGLACGAGVLTLGFVAPQLFPALELAARSDRGVMGLDLEAASVGSAALADVTRGVLGTFAAREDPSPMLWTNNWVWVWPALGFLLVPIAGISHRMRFEWMFWIVIAGLSALFATGSETWVFRVYHALPLGDLFRLPSRIAFVYGFALSIPCAIGVQVLIDRARSGGSATAAGVVACVLLAFTAYDAGKRSAVPRMKPVSEPVPQSLRERIDDPSHRVFLQNPSNRTRTPIVADKMGTLNRIHSLPDYEPLPPSDYARFFDVPDPAVWHGDLHLMRWRTLTPVRPLDLMGVRYYLGTDTTDERVAEIGPSLSKLTTQPWTKIESFVLSERPQAVPRAHVFRCVHVVADEKAALRRIRHPDFSPRMEAVVHGDLGVELDAVFDDCERTDSADTARIESAESNTVRIRAQCGAPCLQTLSDLDYPGWEVSIDGVPGKILRVNGIFRGVVLDPGSHEIVYRFRPRSFWAGSALASLSLGFLAVLGARKIWRSEVTQGLRAMQTTETPTGKSKRRNNHASNL